MNRFISIVIVCLLLHTISLAQIPGLTQFTTSNGLTSNTIYDTVQDEDGFIWFATDYGISKFDGLTFKNFTTIDGLPGNEILSFYKDSQNRIWMVAFNGNVGFIKNGKLYNKNNSPYLEKLKSTTFISYIFEDSKGQIWFYQNLKNIKVLQTDLKVKYYTINDEAHLKFSSIIVEDNYKQTHLLTYINKNNKVIIITKPISENSNSTEWKKFNPMKFPNSIKEIINKNLGLSMREENNIIKNIYSYLANENNIFLSKVYLIGEDYWVTNINEGVLIFNKSNNYSIPQIILKNIQTTRSYVDNENNIWIGSQSNGVFLFPNLHIQGIQFDKSKKNDLHTLSFFQDKIIVGNEQSEFILLNTKTLKTIATYKVDENLKRIRQLNVKDNSLYILSDYNIHKLDSNLNIERIINMHDTNFTKGGLKNFKDICIENDYIFTANAGGVGKIGKSSKSVKKIWNKRSTAISFDKSGNLWIGTTSGLYNYNSNNSTTEKYDLGEQFNNSIIYALEDSSKGLLIGSNSYGFGILKNNVFKTFSTKDGLLSNYIKSIFVDTKNNIWLSTNFGLNCLALNDANELISIKSYTTSDGLYSNDVRASYVLENKVYVATSKGLNIIDLSKELSSISTPSVYINEILLNNNYIEKSNEQVFNNLLNNVQFNFSGISFKSLGNITFKYRLKGLEPEWITTKINTIRYSSLPPNNYTFELKAISKNKLESTPILFSFIINPPYYKTWWFIGVFTFIIIAILTFILYDRNLKLKRKQKTKEQISNLRYQALNAQMNPHFINNLLVKINSLVRKGQLDDVKNSLDKFAELVNIVLNSTKSNLINLNDEIKMAELYLELQKLRFNKNNSYSINIGDISTDDLDAILVPPMILQPIIENSFKHGFKNETKLSTISINFKIKNDDYLICEISDNGVGIQKLHKDIPKSKSSGISFNNINERLRLINESKNDEKLIFISNITDEFNTLVGLKVTLKIPLISF
tara:strand:- start:45504 stop:48440 length:2937 start_codon:yes stop_codon:yes gene_type:complete